MGCGASSKPTANVVANDYRVVLPKPKQTEARLDEFEEFTITALPENDLAGTEFKHGHPSFRADEVVPCFDNGLLFRVVKRDVWAFYNDTRSYEMHVNITFGSSSQITAIGRTQMTQDAETGDFLAEAVVYPGETVMYVKGVISGHRSKIKALPISEAYLESRVKAYYDRTEPEMNEVQKITVDCKSENKLLAQCVKSGIPFVDLKFPPNQDSISKGSTRHMRPVPWARPDMYLSDQLSPLVRVFRNKVTPMSIEKGGLGDSWVMCAIAAMAENPELVRNAFRHPANPELTAKERAIGAYRVTINKNGWWRSVIVDSYLPIIGGKPKYAMSRNDPCEMWVSVLQKAYAKLHGSYANIIAGDPLLAIQDFTGFPTTRFDEVFANTQEKNDAHLIQRLEQYSRRGFQIILSTPYTDVRKSVSVSLLESPTGPINELEMFYRDAGLLMGHAYTVRRVRYFKSDRIALFEICNPWLRGVEWKGPWGSNDKRWKRHPEIARECQHPAKEEGAFWMSWEDIPKYFNGCGVVFTQPSTNDYRISGVFKNGIPSVCLQFSVQKKVYMGFMLCQEDAHRPLTESINYPPIMLTLSKGKGSQETMEIELNTNLDADRPTDQLTFMRSRDVSMMCILNPEDSPYLVVPRILTEKVGEIPYVIALICNEELGKSDIKVDFRELPPESEVFSNSTTFSGFSKPTSAQVQSRRPNSGFPVETLSKKLSAKASRKDTEE